ncbi:MAG: hypothetical protein U9O95_07840 [Candidatus Marinimicrobia bacterium]|nr:hypothetical protein [Candidatus Neomarinimicrobiota bacterium]
MKKHIVYIMIFILLMPSSTAYGRDNDQQNIYKKAVAFEKNGDYVKAESLYVDLYSANPDNSTYFTRYKNMLILQRKYKDLLPVMELQANKRKYDRYLKLELGVLYYALNDPKNARKYWSVVFKGQTGSMKNSYANAVYYDVIEYGMGSNFPLVVNDLRKITGDPKLLVNYNFYTSLRYRNWDQAVNEILHILENDPNDLRYVRASLFSFDPLSALYRRAINGLQDQNSTKAKELLSEIYIHLGKYETAYVILSEKSEEPLMHDIIFKFANRMFRQDQFKISFKASKWTEEHHTEVKKKRSMALLAARSEEQLFYELIEEASLISRPYKSHYTNLRFKPFDQEEANLIESAYHRYDSLSVFRDITGEIARQRHADITYRIYQDFDKAFKEYNDLSNISPMKSKRYVISRISDLYIAKGEYQKAVEFLETAPSKYHMMVHEEDQLLPQKFFASVIAGDKDSLTQKAKQVLAMLPLDDPLYNDILAYTELINIVMKDSMHYDAWLDAEQFILQNNTASAGKIFEELINERSGGMKLYALRYLDCLNSLNDTISEGKFWEEHYKAMLETDMSDYFMLRYADFLEKMQKFHISIEIFEKYLLSYQESMYYEHIREYVRQHYSLGAP